MGLQSGQDVRDIPCGLLRLPRTPHQDGMPEMLLAGLQNEAKTEINRSLLRAMNCSTSKADQCRAPTLSDKLGFELCCPEQRKQAALLHQFPSQVSAYM